MLLTFWLFTRIPIVSKLPEYTSSTKFTATEGYFGVFPYDKYSTMSDLIDSLKNKIMPKTK